MSCQPNKRKQTHPCLFSYIFISLAILPIQDFLVDFFTDTKGSVTQARMPVFLQVRMK